MPPQLHSATPPPQSPRQRSPLAPPSGPHVSSPPSRGRCCQHRPPAPTRPLAPRHKNHPYSRFTQRPSPQRTRITLIKQLAVQSAASLFVPFVRSVVHPFGRRHPHSVMRSAPASTEGRFSAGFRHFRCHAPQPPSLHSPHQLRTSHLSSHFKSEIRDLKHSNSHPKHKTQRTKNQEPRTKNQEPRTKNQEPRTKNQEPRTKNPTPPIAFRADCPADLAAFALFPQFSILSPRRVAVSPYFPILWRCFAKTSATGRQLT
jgi:hypothetical protein